MNIEQGSRRLYPSLLLLVGISLLFAGALLPARGFAATCNDTAGETLPAGNSTTDLEVTGPCEVKAGAYIFRNVNIYKKSGAAIGGSRAFDDVRIDFFAESIVIENHGSMTAGTTEPMGANGVITIHLWGAASDPGVTCKTDVHCGIPNNIWDSNLLRPIGRLTPRSCKISPGLPGGVSDCFYDYDTLDDSDRANGIKAYFGHKYAFSKKLENHRAAVALWIAFYNFCRIHETLRCTPAMGAWRDRSYLGDWQVNRCSP